MRAHSTTVDPKCDILFVPDGVLGAGEAMRRREFIAFIGSTAVAWPLVARAQQSAMPVVGLLDQRSPDELTDRLRGFRQGLRDSGFVEGRNVAIDYRWAENKLDRLPDLAADLVRRQVAVIATTSGVSPTLASNYDNPGGFRRR
jgi:putative tryptophan/tyrosine transport system substrate-binding protein